MRVSVSECECNTHVSVGDIHAHEWVGNGVCVRACGCLDTEVVLEGDSGIGHLAWTRLHT